MYIMLYSRPGGGSSNVQAAAQVYGNLPPGMRQQVNQAATQAAVNELSSVFSNRFK